MERITRDIEGGHLRAADFDAFLIVACIGLTRHRQPGFGRGGGDQFGHRFPAGQGLPAPGLGDVAEQSRTIATQSP